MKTFTAFFCLLFVANSVLADAYSAAIRQAKNVAANASSTRQDNPPAAGSATARSAVANQSATGPGAPSHPAKHRRPPCRFRRLR